MCVSITLGNFANRVLLNEDQKIIVHQAPCCLTMKVKDWNQRLRRVNSLANRILKLIIILLHPAMTTTSTIIRICWKKTKWTKGVLKWAF